jgi:hypothetical protein
MNGMNDNGTNEADDLGSDLGLDPDLGSDLEITKVSRRHANAGTWVAGRVHGHQFQALVFPEHATVSGYEIDDSRISKLWLQRIADQREVYSWDRGLDRAAEDATTQAIVDFLAAGLAEYAYGK